MAGKAARDAGKIVTEAAAAAAGAPHEVRRLPGRGRRRTGDVHGGIWDCRRGDGRGPIRVPDAAAQKAVGQRFDAWRKGRRAGVVWGGAA